MGVVKNLMVRAGADFSAITRQADRAKSSMQGMHKSVSKSCNGISAVASKMNKVLGTIGVGLSVTAIISAAKSAKETYDEQAEASAKLAQVMHNTMGARAEEVKSIEDLIDAQERAGVVTGDVQTEGAQELATYLTMTSSLKTLIPVLNDMVAQQYGMAASGESAVSIATMMGKVMNGQTSALSRYGYSFTAAQEAVLKFGDEEQRAAVLADVVSQSVGGMNAALAATPNGRLQQVSNTLGKIKEDFGHAVNSVLVLFIPALNFLCDILAKVAVLANKVAQTIANVFGVSPSNAESTVKYTNTIGGALGDVEDAAKSAAKAMNTLGFDQITKLNPNSSADDASSDEDIGSSIIGGIAVGADEAGESVGWLERMLSALRKKLATINTGKLVEGLKHLKESLVPLTEKLFSGLSWGIDNVLVPLIGWTVENGLPAFLDALSSAAIFLDSALRSLKPVGEWLWGNFLKPIADWAGDRAVRILEAMSGVLSDLADLLDGKISFKEFIEQLEPLEVALLGVATAASAAKVALGALNIGKAIASGAGAPVIAGIAVAVSIVDIAVNWDEIRSMWKNIGEGIGSIFSGDMKGAGQKFTDAFVDWMGMDSLGQKLAQSIVDGFGGEGAWARAKTYLEEGGSIFDVFRTAPDSIKQSWSGIGEWFNRNVADPIKSAFSSIGTWLSTNVTTPIKDSWNNLKMSLQTMWGSVSTWFTEKVSNPIKNTFVSCRTTIQNAFLTLKTNVQGLWDTVSNWFKERVINPIVGAFSSFRTNVTGIFTNIKTSIQGVFSSISNWVKTKVIDPISSTFKGFANGIIGFVEGLVNAGIRGINSLIGAFNKINFNIPDWIPLIGGKHFAISISKVNTVSLPRLATGHVVEPNNEFAAILGDNKYEQEIVSPVSTMKQAFRDVLMSLGVPGRSSGPQKLVIPVYVGGRKITERVIEDINLFIETTGECPINI